MGIKMAVLCIVFLVCGGILLYVSSSVDRSRVAFMQETDKYLSQHERQAALTVLYTLRFDNLIPEFEAGEYHANINYLAERGWVKLAVGEGWPQLFTSMLDKAKLKAKDLAPEATAQALATYLKEETGYEYAEWLTGALYKIRQLKDDVGYKKIDIKTAQARLNSLKGVVEQWLSVLEEYRGKMTPKPTGKPQPVDEEKDG